MKNEQDIYIKVLILISSKKRKVFILINIVAEVPVILAFGTSGVWSSLYMLPVDYLSHSPILHVSVCMSLDIILLDKLW